MQHGRQSTVGRQRNAGQVLNSDRRFSRSYQSCAAALVRLFDRKFRRHALKEMRLPAHCIRDKADQPIPP
jgi:hypothetical protein